MCNTEARELVLYIQNDGMLYKTRHVPIMQNLCKHIAKARYDRSEAMKSYMSLAEDGAKAYVKEYGSPDDKWNVMFPLAARNIAAMELLNDFEEEYRCNKQEGINPVAEDKRLDLD